jgi:sugar phosphate isomerase/epimerase
MMKPLPGAAKRQTMKNRMTRRTLLGLMAAAAGAPLAGPGPALANGMNRVRPIGLQLYTVRDLLAADVPGTLATIAEIGYGEVETAGYAGLTAAEFASALNDAGLRAPSAHVPLTAVETDPDSLLEAAATVGHRYLVVPWLTEEQRDSLDKYRHLADVMNDFGARCHQAGLQLAYHNHDFEFVPLDGTVPYDLLLERCDPERVRFELDLFWAVKAGVDPAALLEASPGRYPLCHVKDMDSAGAMVPVGEGDIDFPALFRAGVTGGLKHFFVEHDNPADAIESIRTGFASVSAMRY